MSTSRNDLESQRSIEVFYAYPTSLNQDAVLKLSKAFLGQIDWETSHAAWDVAGFALSQFDVHKPMKAAPPLSMESARQYLDELAAGKMHLDPYKLFQIAVMVISMLAS